MVSKTEISLPFLQILSGIPNYSVSSLPKHNQLSLQTQLNQNQIINWKTQNFNMFLVLLMRFCLHRRAEVDCFLNLGLLNFIGWCLTISSGGLNWDFRDLGLLGTVIYIQGVRYLVQRLHGTVANLEWRRLPSLRMMLMWSIYAILSL